jgi:hypothetical protein
MNKPITMVIKETKNKLVNVCNESGLSPAVLDLIMQGLYSEIHSLAERQAAEEEMAYVKMLKENAKTEDVSDKI